VHDGARERLERARCIALIELTLGSKNLASGHVPLCSSTGFSGRYGPALDRATEIYTKIAETF
jgi:hypothetical protein